MAPWLHYTLLLVIVFLAANVVLTVAEDDALTSSSSSSSESESESESEREALLSTGWWGNQIHSTCNLTGIECNKAGRVISIDLAVVEIYIGNGFGKLNFSSFPYLQILDLSYCGVSGSIPYQIGMLSELNHLYLSYNRLTGELPSSLNNLAQLQVLDISHNNFNGSIPYQIGMLSKLNHLSLSYNSLTGNLPSSLGNLNQLGMLHLSHNHLNGSIPYQIGMLSTLWHLDLSYNSLTGSIPVFKNCSSLRYLDLSHNFLSGHIPKQLGHCPFFKVVNLNSNNLTGTIPNEFLCLAQLNYLDLSDNNLSDPIPPANYPYAGRQTCDFSHNNPNSVLLVLYILLLLTIIGLPVLILAFVFFCRHTPYYIRIFEVVSAFFSDLLPTPAGFRPTVYVSDRVPPPAERIDLCC